MRKCERKAMSPLGAVTRGLVAGAVGTAAMDLLMYRRYKRGGGEQGVFEWESAAGLDDWDDAPAPAIVGKRLVEGLFQVKLAPDWARVTNNVIHWATGILWGAQHGIVAGSAPIIHAWHGLGLGTAAWSASYVVLPLAKLYQPVWEYDARTLAKDYSAHLVYGATAGLVFRMLAPKPA